MRKIRIAFIKYGGMTLGGSEKLLQNIAAYLPKNRFEVTYFYTDMVKTIGPYVKPLQTDADRIRFVRSHGVKLVKCSLRAIDLTTPSYIWRDTDFFSLFNEDDFDIIQTCRGGHKEFPFTKIRKKPIIDIIALSSGSDNQYNLSRVLHLCSWSRDGWVRRGGDKARSRIISLPVVIENEPIEDLRKVFGLKDCFIFGMHQRPSDAIFSPTPLQAYSCVETDKTVYILMGGSNLYKQQAKALGIKHIIFLEPTGDSFKIFSFLKTLDVYAHGRKDGEVNSQAMAEAMYFGLPIVSHTSPVNNGHVECIADAGRVVGTVKEYQEELKMLMLEKEYYLYRSKKSKERFRDKYELKGQLDQYIAVYEDVQKNPFPRPLRRFLTSLHYTQNIRTLLVWLYLKIRTIKLFLFKNW